MTNKQKLELVWYGKEKGIKVEPRLLIENPDLSHKEDDRHNLFSYDNQNQLTSNENLLIHGDNLLALKALEDSYSKKVKCIYIDPPYNTGSAFEHYDDNLEHSTWLSLMKPRLELLKNLLRDDGTIWISIDADESHYLKVLCDEVFGRKNFVDEIVWQRAYAPINLKKTLSRSHDIVLVYAKKFDSSFELNKLPRSKEALKRYINPDSDSRGLWQSDNLWVGPRVEKNVYEIITPSGKKILPPEGYSCRLSKERFQEFIEDNRIWFGEDGNNTPRIKRFLSEVKDGVTAMTWWPREQVGDNQEAKREIKKLFGKSIFDTPKPERLIYRILLLATNEGDIVLDSFLGSGTTTAVAHKMNRRWIGIEMGDHAYTHCKLRMDLIISGKDEGGVTKSVKWQSGGGYKFYELASTLIKEDKFGQKIINSEYNAEMLASAVAKHEGYKYNPDTTIFWKQSSNDSKSYLFVTTKHITKEYLISISSEMQVDEYLVIVCKSYDSNIEHEFKNIEIKKIPQSLLSNCEYDVDDYNLNIIHPPVYDEEEDLDD